MLLGTYIRRNTLVEMKCLVTYWFPVHEVSRLLYNKHAPNN